MKDIIKQFEQISQNPYKWAKKQAAETGRKCIAYTCRYLPEELLHAAGFQPLRIWGNIQPSPRVNAHLQTYCCNVVKSILDRMLSGELDYLTGAIFSHSCDSLQCLSDIWELNSQYGLHDTFNMPTRLDSPASLEYLVQELRRIKTRLEEFTEKEITDASLQESINIFETSRGLLRKLYSIRRENPGVISDSRISDIVIASTIMDRIKYNELLESLLQSLPAEKDLTRKTGANVFLTGSICTDHAFYQILNELNLAVTSDDLCNGQRYFERVVPSDQPPLEAIARSFIDGNLCPAKYHAQIDRAQDIIAGVRQSAADAVIFYLHKFCEPHFFDYPHIKKELDRAGIPSILIEIEKPGYNIGQLKSRLEAFSEMIAHRSQK